MADQVSDDAAALARQRALEIASRLSSKLGVPEGAPANGGGESVLGKRGREEFPVSDGRPIGSLKKKVFVPQAKFPDVNFFGLIIGPRGSTLKQMENDTGARIFLRGKGASKDGEEESDEELHVLIMAEDDPTLERASQMIEDLLHNPDKMAQLKQQQLSQVAAGEYGSAANVSLPSSLYSDDALSNPIAFQAHEKVHGETQELRIPHEKVGLVIGRSGETIKSIQVQTGCHIQIAKENECPGPDRTVSLSGEPGQIEAARSEILRIITETGRAAALTRGPTPSTPGLGHPQSHYGPPGGMYGGGSGMSGGGFNSGGAIPGDGNQKTIHIPQIYVGLLIGKSGETIRNIQMKTGTLIQVQKDESSDPITQNRPVTLIGPPHSVNQAEAEINTLIANSQVSGGAPPGVTGPTTGASQSQNVQIPNAGVGVIIGRMGETIKRIQSVTGTRVQISKDEGKPEREVTITGTQQQIEHARREIDMVLQGVELREMPPRGPGGPDGHGRYNGPPGRGPPGGGYGGRQGPPHGGGGGYGGYNRSGPPGGHGGYGPPPGPYGGHPGYGPPPGHYGGPPGYPPHGADPYGGGYGAPPPHHAPPPHVDPYAGAYGAPPHAAHAAHAPHAGAYGAYGAPAAAPVAAQPVADTKPAGATDQAAYEAAYYAHQASYYAQHGAYDTAPFVWPPK